MRCLYSIPEVLTSGLLTDRTVRWRTVSTVATVGNNADTPDPLAEKYPQFSPYAHCAGNPLRYVGRDGKEWHINGSQSAIWLEEGEHIDGYTNIGNSYTLNTNGLSITYNRDQISAITYSALSDKDFEQQQGKTDCKKTSDRMFRKSGAVPSVGRGGEILMTHHDENGVATTPTHNVTNGIERLSENIKNGKAVTVGVDYKTTQKHNKAPTGDGMTDHFVTVMSLTEHMKGSYVKYISFRFFDPGTKKGNSPSNEFFISNDTLIKGTKYTVTTVRAIK